MDYYIQRMIDYNVWYLNLMPADKAGLIGQFILGKILHYSHIVEEATKGEFKSTEVALKFELN